MASYEKINYLLRPSKHVERRLFVEALQRLSKAGYFLSDYTYVGLGSIYYADFYLCYKYLHIERMYCFEVDPIGERMEFNKPYPFIVLRMNPIAAYLAEIDRKRKHLVWLDYDGGLNSDVLSDIRSFVETLAPGSVFIFSIVADPNRVDEFIPKHESGRLSRRERLGRAAQLIQELLGDYLYSPFEKRHINKDELPEKFASALKAFIIGAMGTRHGLKFYQLFNFTYNDGTLMLTIGGIIDTEDCHSIIESSGILKLDFIQPENPPVHISVPQLTTREKQWLEKYRAGTTRGRRRHVPFEMSEELINNFVKYHKYYPTYAETNP